MKEKMKWVFEGRFRTMADPTGLGKYKNCPLIYQYDCSSSDSVEILNWHRCCVWWLRFHFLFWQRVCRIASHDLFPSSILKQPTIWFSFAMYHDTLKWYLNYACWVQFYKDLNALLQQSQDFGYTIAEILQQAWLSCTCVWLWFTCECKRYHTGTFSEPGYCLNCGLMH